MTRSILYCTFMLLAGTLSLTAQEDNFTTLSLGNGYGSQSFHALDRDDEHQVANDAWDIAFSTAGQIDAGIFINESAGSSRGMPQASIELYDIGTNDFTITIDSETLTEEMRLYNPEGDWITGAFNVLRNPQNPLDYGWGVYNPSIFTVEGGPVYVLKLRDGSYRKLQMESLSGQGIYSFKYANLDGSNEQLASVSKADYADQTLAYFSFTTGTTVDVEPDYDFDLLFCRYSTILEDPAGGPDVNYPVSGILHGPGIEVAQADGVDPYDADVEPFQDSFDTDLTVIGHDWKTFDFSAGWMIPTDRAYFLKTPEDRIWKLVFVDFEGSSTGTAIFEKFDLGLVSSVQTPSQINLRVLTYPNPVQAQFTLALTTPEALANSRSTLRVYSANGTLVHTQNLQLASGFQVWEASAQTWPVGTYFLQLASPLGPIQLGSIVKVQ